MTEVQPFYGFPREGVQFLEDLAHNNNREWFEAHRQDYREHLLAPAQSFVIALGQELKSISSAIEYDTRTNGSGSIMRIHRDVRFSKDKTPYYTYLRVVFWEGGHKKMENPSF